VIGKFGAESKLSNTIMIEPETANATTAVSNVNNELSLSFRKLLDPCCLTNQEKDEFEKIVMQTSDLCFHLETQYKFYVHKVNFYYNPFI